MQLPFMVGSMPVPVKSPLWDFSLNFRVEKDQERTFLRAVYLIHHQIHLVLAEGTTPHRPPLRQAAVFYAPLHGPLLALAGPLPLSSVVTIGSSWSILFFATSASSVS